MFNFRDIDKNLEILALIDNAPEKNKGEIWQTQSDKRHHYKITQLRKDEKKQVIIFEAAAKYEFDPSQPVYVRINPQDLIFKLEAENFIISDNRLACPYPTIAKAIEKRENGNRVLLSKAQDASVMLAPLKSMTGVLGVRVADISRSGLGIITSERNRDYLFTHGHFKLKAFNETMMPEGGPLATVRYVEKIGKGMVKVGLALSAPLSEEAFEFVCKIVLGSDRDRNSAG